MGKLKVFVAPRRKVVVLERVLVMVKGTAREDPKVPQISRPLVNPMTEDGLVYTELLCLMTLFPVGNTLKSGLINISLLKI